MWISVGYYALLLLVGAVSIAILGKILRVYDLSQKMQGKKGINWNNIMGIVCIIFLIAGIYGAYWSLTVQGSMTLPEAASAHGVDMDNMFTVTSYPDTDCIFPYPIAVIWFCFLLPRIG